jgi:hypothetical protein
MARDIDIIIEHAREQLPAVIVRQHDAMNSSDDEGIWWFSMPGVKRDVHVESSSATCPFVIETDEQSSGEALRASSVDQAVQLVVEYLTAAARESGPIHPNAERYWP